MGKEGEPYEYENLATEEQQEVMKQVGQLLERRIDEPATPYGGQLNAPYDPGQLAAMNTMMGMGGQGQYNAPKMPLGPAPTTQAGTTGPSTYMDYYTTTDVAGGTDTGTDVAGGTDTGASTNLDAVTNPIEPVTDATIAPMAGPVRVGPIGPPGPAGPIGPAALPTSEPLPSTQTAPGVWAGPPEVGGASGTSGVGGVRVGTTPRRGSPGRVGPI